MEENAMMIGEKRDEEIELDLGLSIGGSVKKSEKLNQKRTMNEPNGPKTIGFDTDLLIESSQEIEALQRQEERRKRQEKQQKKRTCNNGGYGVGLDYKMWLNSPELENEVDVKQECKKIRVEEEEESGGPRSNNNMEMKNVNLNFTVEQNVNNMNNNQNIVGFNSTVCPVMYPYPPVQYVQIANGFQYPCLNVVPCWAAGGAGVGNEQNMVQSAMGPSFRSFQSGQVSGQNMGNGCASDQNSWKAGFNGSPICSSSAVSDNKTSSHEGGASSDTRSHSSHSLQKQRKLPDSKANETNVQSEHSASSHLSETGQVHDETTNYSTYSGKPKTSSNNAQCSSLPTNSTTYFAEQKMQPSNAVDCCQTKPKEEAATELQQISTRNPVSTTENLSPALSKESKKNMGKPPKPQTQNQNQNTPPLPHMPCVSTTGDGPNGKTVNGFLYRYTKTEVSIICVCHGTSFSPAEFVQHAGGTDVSHPLKNITVIPSAF